MRSSQERSFTTQDGTTRPYRYWPAATANAKGAVVLHLGHEPLHHIKGLVDEFGLTDFAVFAYRAATPAPVRDRNDTRLPFATEVRDLDHFVRQLSQAHEIPIGNIALVADRIAAVVAATWAHDYAPKLRCLVLAAPSFGLGGTVSSGSATLALLYRLRGDFQVRTNATRGLLHKRSGPEHPDGHDAGRTSYTLPASYLLGSSDASARIVADAAAIQVPVQLLVDDSAPAVQRSVQRVFFERLASTGKVLHTLPSLSGRRAGDTSEDALLGPVRTFIAQAFAHEPALPSLESADTAGYTCEEATRLQAALPTLSPAGLRFAAMRASLRTLGRLSTGVRLGLRTGFDSGSTLDYVYRNRACGTTPLGRLIDRNYLNAIGWRGIRARKTHLQQAITTACDRLRARGRPVRIVDIAAGHGRYVLDAIGTLPQRPDSVLLRDYSPLNVTEGSRLIAERKLDGVARFRAGDAFDAGSLAAIEPRPSLAIVSGLYELFPENGPVRRSLGGLAQAVRPGDYLIYTGQPWHPQLETIARTLTSHRGGRAWVMRRRTQAELDQLVEHAGFRKQAQWIDPWGIFTVSLAVRV